MRLGRPSNTAAIVTGVIGAEAFLVQPGLVGGLVEAGGLGASEAGLIVSAEMLGMAVASLLLTIRLRLPWKPILVTAALAMAAGNLACMAASAFPVLVAARLLAGVGSGGFVALSFVALGRADDQDRAYGFYISWCLLYGAIGLFGLPRLVEAGGLGPVFAIFAVLPLAALPFASAMARSSDVAASDSVSTDGRDVTPLAPIAGLGAVFAYFLAQGSVWAFLDRFGIAGGLEYSDVGNALAICSIAGIAGAVLATWQGPRWGRRTPLAFGVIVSVASLLLMGGRQQVLGFTILASLFNAAWNYVHPYLLASMAAWDRSGRIVLWTAALQTFGLAAGPALGAAVLTGNDFGPVRHVAAALFVISLAMMLPAAGVRLAAPVRRAVL